ncbi:MAG: methyltransferase domain-containing protein, partial [Acidobacteria bacterium]|nr:methyltransferase domain-containing protein [Acidobacteriota bacterium]
MPHLHRSTEAMTIDIGCGKNKIEPGSLGLDQRLDSSADVVCNLDRLPWPLRDNSASRIHLSHILEHLDDLMGVMGEVYRIAQPRA